MKKKDLWFKQCWKFNFTNISIRFKTNFTVYTTVFMFKKLLLYSLKFSECFTFVSIFKSYLNTGMYRIIMVLNSLIELIFNLGSVSEVIELPIFYENFKIPQSWTKLLLGKDTMYLVFNYFCLDNNQIVWSVVIVWSRWVSIKICHKNWSVQWKWIISMLIMRMNDISIVFTQFFFHS